jgi:hypothetical protein
LGENEIDKEGLRWNPGFEEREPGIEPPKPRHWSFEDPYTGSTYEQEAEEPCEGVDYVKLADEPPGGEGAWAIGKIILDPENVNPKQLGLEVDPDKYYTIRVHGRHENPEQIKYKGLGGMLWYEDDDVKTEADLTVLDADPEAPPAWERSDHRIPAGVATVRKIQRLLFKFGAASTRATLPHQRWCVDAVSIAETFPATAEFFASGDYASPIFYTPPTVSNVVWGEFAAVTSKPTGTDIQFEIRGPTTRRPAWPATRRTRRSARRVPEPHVGSN